MLDLALVYQDLHADINVGVAAEIWPDTCTVQAFDGASWVTTFTAVPCLVKFSRAPFPLTGKWEDAYIIKLPMQTAGGTAITVNEGQRLAIDNRDDNDPGVVFEVVTNKRRSVIFTELICRQIGLGDGAGCC